MINNTTIVFKCLEKDKRFRNKLEVYLYFRLWGVNNKYKPFIGTAEDVKKFFNLKQPLNIIKETLNYMYKCELIGVEKSYRYPNKYIIYSRYLGNRIGDFYLMSPEDTLSNINKPDAYEKFVIRDSKNLLRTRCDKCPYYGIDCCIDNCLTVLMQKVEQYENILGLN